MPVTFMADTATVLIVDRIGYLRDLYGLADVVFVGKSLRGSGGQNMLEPLSLGKPTLVGPRTENFRDVVSIFTQRAPCLKINTPAGTDRATAVICYMTPSDAQGLASQRKRKSRGIRGATEVTVRAIEEILGP